MEVNEVKTLIEQAFPDGEVSVELHNGHYTITVISEMFSGLRLVARQQRIYAPLSDVIAAGDIHAVNIFARTPAEAEMD